MVARTVFALAISPPCANVSLRHSRGRSLTARRKGEPRGPTSRWRRKPTPKHPCSRSLQPGCRMATLDPTNGLAIEDTTIASDGSFGPLAKSLPGIIKLADRHPSSVSAGRKRFTVPALSAADVEGLGMAVDGDGLAGNHPRCGGGEEEAHIGDLLRLHEALDRLGLDILSVNGIAR